MVNRETHTLDTSSWPSHFFRGICWASSDVSEMWQGLLLRPFYWRVGGKDYKGHNPSQFSNTSIAVPEGMCCILQRGKPLRPPQDKGTFVSLPQSCIALTPDLKTWLGLSPQRTIWYVCNSFVKVDSACLNRNEQQVLV